MNNPHKEGTDQSEKVWKLVGLIGEDKEWTRRVEKVELLKRERKENLHQEAWLLAEELHAVLPEMDAADIHERLLAEGDSEGLSQMLCAATKR